MKWLFTALWILALYSGVAQSALISQSSISRCDWGDDSEPNSGDGRTCKSKFVVSMTLKGGQGETESLYANIDKAYEEGDKELKRLKKPFRLEMQKSQVLASYRAYYIGSANARPTERVIRKKTCRDSWYTPVNKLPCRKQIDVHGNYVWDSQGYCCRCRSGDIFEHRARSGVRCGLIGEVGDYGAAHCMQLHELWYDIFELSNPILQYNITVGLLEYSGIAINPVTKTKFVNWTTVSSFQLNPSRTMGRSQDGKVVAEVQGNLMGAKGFKDFSYKYLLVPSITHWKNKTLPVQYTNGPRDWLLVDQHLVDLSGTECHRVGVYYSGFRRMPGKCYAEILPGQCFTNQPLDFWEHDDKLRNEKKTGKYMVHNYGNVHNSSHTNNKSFILRFIHEDLHNTFVTFRIDASDILFVTNVGSGRILDAHATNFTALEGYGMISVEVENTGEITAEFSVSVMKCNQGIQQISAKTVTINPGQVTNVTFKVGSANSKAGGDAHECEVQLYDSQYNLLQTATVNFLVGSTCFCYGICGCTCESEDGQVVCPTPPPVVIKAGPIAVRAFLILMESIGAEGIVGFLGGILLLLGFMKLACGGVICCRKTKAQEFSEKQLEKKGFARDPKLVRCGGQCRGAKAAQDRYKRKVQRLKRMGKKTNQLDDWRNTSFVCSCNDELADIKFVQIIKAVCFFYYCLFVPCVWLGKKVFWGVLRDTVDKKQKAEQAVLMAARKKGNLEKYGVVDLAAEIKKFEGEMHGEKKVGADSNPVAKDGLVETVLLERVAHKAAAADGVDTTVGGGIGMKEEKVETGKKDKKGQKEKKRTKKGDKKREKETQKRHQIADPLARAESSHKSTQMGKRERGGKSTQRKERAGGHHSDNEHEKRARRKTKQAPGRQTTRKPGKPARSGGHSRLPGQHSSVPGDGQSEQSADNEEQDCDNLGDDGLVESNSHESHKGGEGSSHGSQSDEHGATSLEEEKEEEEEGEEEGEEEEEEEGESENSEVESSETEDESSGASNVESSHTDNGSEQSGDPTADDSHSVTSASGDPSDDELGDSDGTGTDDSHSKDDEGGSEDDDSHSEDDEGGSEDDDSHSSDDSSSEDDTDSHSSDDSGSEDDTDSHSSNNSGSEEDDSHSEDDGSGSGDDGGDDD